MRMRHACVRTSTSALTKAVRCVSRLTNNWVVFRSQVVYEWFCRNWPSNTLDYWIMESDIATPSTVGIFSFFFITLKSRSE